MKKNHLLLFTTLLFPCAAYSALYLEPRVAHLSISGTPDVGDVGVETSSDIPDYIPTIQLGWEITSRINLEVRYARIDDIVIEKTAMSSAIFPLPPNGVALTVLTPYEYTQESQIISCALPIDVLEREKFFLTLTPLIQFEEADIRLNRKYGTAQNGIPNPPPIYEETESSQHFGGEVSAGYKFSKRFSATLSYTYAPLSKFDANFVSAGVRFTF